MPAYNCEKFIRIAIDSMLEQTYSNFELLIADDASFDRTKEIIDSYLDPRIKRFHNETNLGYLQASNKLFEKCTGTYVSFQDADDFSDPTRMEKLVSFLENNRDISVVSSDINRLDKDGNILSRSHFPQSHEDIFRDFLGYRTVMAGSAMMLRAEVVTDIGTYDLYFDRIGYEDFYWFSKIIQKYQVACIGEPLYNYRSNPNSVTKTQKDPKAIIGHDLIIYMLNRRLQGKEDYIESGNWTKADIIAELILTVTKARQNNLVDKVKGIGRYIKELFMYPAVSISFFRHFMSSLIKG
jgi:glycosyltransferase involved in cell wall biosynthesis